MSCNGKSWTRFVPVYTKSSSADTVFFAATPPIRSAEFDTARVSFEIVSTEAGVSVQRAYRTSNDGVTWDNAVTFGAAAVTAAGWHYGTFGTLTVANLKTYVELGLLVNTANNGTVNYGEMNVASDVRLG